MATTSNFWGTNLGKTIKTAAYLAVSAVVGYLVTATTNEPELFGPMTVIVNLGLVFIKQTFFDSSTRNVGSN